jgi:DNA recombination protein RmuC
VTIILALIVGIAVGGIAAWFVAHARATTDAASLQAEVARLTAERQGAEDRLRALTEDEKRVQALAAEALRQNNTSFLQLAQTQFAPIKETLDKFDLQTRELEVSRQKAYGTLFTQVQSLAQGQEKLRTETGNLVKALRAPHVRGRWGEMQLKRVVELAGMVPYCDFVEQLSASNDDGRLLRPDLVVKLPGGKNVVVDAKAPLSAYLDALEAEDEGTRNVHLQAHARQVREHVTKLAAKAYWKQFEPAPDFVVMFLPDETFFRMAIEQDSTLLELGPENGVLVATPTMLIGLLKTIAHGWQQETVAEKAREIAGLGRDLYERLGTFGRHLAKAGRGLDTAVGSYNEAVASLETRVLVTARKFRETGAVTSELPETPPIEKVARPIHAAELIAPSTLELPPA